MEDYAQLKRLVLATLVDMWPTANGALSSENIYTRLVDSGEDIPEGVMRTIFEELEAQNLIRGAKPLNRNATKQHGGVVITWVNSERL